MAQRQQEQHWTPIWVGVVVGLASVATALAQRAHLLPLAPGGYLVLGVLGACFAGLATLLQQVFWVPTYVVRAAWCVGTGLWIYRASTGHHAVKQLATELVIGWAVLVAASYIPRPAEPEVPVHDPIGQGLPPEVASWQHTLRAVASRDATVTRVEPWARAADGERVHVQMPHGMTQDDLAGLCPALQAARRLPIGCRIEVKDGAHQGVAVLDVMLRDTLADKVAATDDSDNTPVSINDPFPLMYTPQREPLLFGFRTQSMVIGGSPDSGKTTLLHRIIRRAARCYDCLIWVVDMNGGGVGEPWYYQFATGAASQPTVDWVAGDEMEGAALTAVNVAILKDRKSSPEAIERKRRTGSAILPVDADLPEILTVADEGADLAKAPGWAAKEATLRLSQTAELGRAEGGRVVMSVLRGTGDALDKMQRTCSANRICLKMLEDTEYDHILGINPAKGIRLTHPGSGYVYREHDLREILARSEDISRATIEAVSVACAAIRPQLDDRARAVARTITPYDVLGREPTTEELRHPVLRDAARGLVYENRWVRKGLQAPPPDDEPEPEPVPPGPPPPAPAAGGLDERLARLNEMFSENPTAGPVAPPRVDVNDAAEVARVAGELDAMLAAGDLAEDPFDVPAAASVPDTEVMFTRHRVVAILRDHPAGLSPAQIGTELARADAGVSRQYLQDLLARLVAQGHVERAGGVYRLAS